LLPAARIVPSFPRFVVTATEAAVLCVDVDAAEPEPPPYPDEAGAALDEALLAGVLLAGVLLLELDPQPATAAESAAATAIFFIRSSSEVGNLSLRRTRGSRDSFPPVR
jgi:hypothetical protein